MKKHKGLKGAQVTPSPTPIPPIENDLAPECILVPKVYDWVFFANEIETTNFIPDEAARATVSAAIAAGEVVTAEVVGPENLDDVESFVTILENGNPGRVSIRWIIPLTVNVFINGTLATSFQVTTQASDEIMLCVPVGITEENIEAKAAQVVTEGQVPVLPGGEPFGPIIPINVVLCKSVHVTFEVKLEVLAKFCTPRPNNIVVPRPTLRCDLSSIQFPPQCPDIFPPANTECQGTALARREETVATFGVIGTVIEGLSTMTARIAEECSLATSEFTYTFNATDIEPVIPTPVPPIDTPIELNFTFTPSTFETITCDNTTNSLVVFGQGERVLNGIEEQLVFELRLFEGAQSAQLLLRDTSGDVVFDSGLFEALVDFEECDTFGDLLNLI
ncbi:hypothetical protein N781_16975 [Pontibacillus halophilus JSM 076056 = DSM 19796]|uniref:Uncharacterized protein n=1 Tax=Pontibacillus halophilus JSM 076056 = DSM 19796 TaxID=1385510 RepID=A0A0A5GN05_9BACI|nr:hypothetical protein [Pontibacillus halophilus]KGX92515.1 hypothetical protein N781_16975 [Pontibacillus halophilus JSM 076056 = DSM 19796]